MKMMRLTTLVAVALLPVALLTQGCATKPTVRAEYDHAADFSKYRSFNFASPLSTDKLGYASLLTQQLKTAVTQQMEQRGYQLNPQPDLLVNFSGRLEERQSVQSSPSSYYGYRGGYYSAWPGYGMGSDVYTVNYTQGTLNVDLVDARTQQMVWEGVTIGELKEKHLKNREATINKAVSNIFAKFPFQAGVAQPVATAAK